MHTTTMYVFICMHFARVHSNVVLANGYATESRILGFGATWKNVVGVGASGHVAVGYVFMLRLFLSIDYVYSI